MSSLKPYILVVLIVCRAFSYELQAQEVYAFQENISREYDYRGNDATAPCITPQEYERIEKECAANCKKLGLSTTQKTMLTALSWPLRAASGFTDCSYYFISAHVDHDPASGTYKDYNCGSIAYDGHKGTDIAVFPFGFYKMENSQVEVIAAAAGTIIAKSDGNFDRNCSSNSLTANYVIIQHADGSRALYWHMKKNAVTAKAVGQTVVAGEYLGVVGSSGSSSGPHLHFEIWNGSSSANLIDPFSGSCNILNAGSWWASQKPYTEPAVIKASVHTTDAVMPACPATETPNESTSYTIPFQGSGLPAGAAKFYVFFRNETTGMTASLSILNPNGTVFTSWTQTSTATYKASYRAWTKTLPVTAGTYTFKAVYNGITCTQTFDIITASPASITASGPTTFCQGDSVILTANAGSSYLWSNGATTRSIIVKASGNFSVTVTYAAGGSSTSPVTAVTVNPLPAAAISASGATTFCSGDSVILTSSSGSSYLWSNGATTKSITVKAGGSFTVKVTGANGCSATSAAKSVTVNTPVNGLAILVRNDTLFTPYAAKNYWYRVGTVNAVDSGQYHKCSQSGNYFAKGRDLNGCLATSATVLANCSLTAILPNAASHALIVYPNPTGDQVYIEGLVPENGNYTISVFNELGQVAMEERITIAGRLFHHSVSMGNLPDGLYILMIGSEQFRNYSKVYKTGR